MGFPIARIAARAALIGAMIAGGMLMAGIAQAQAQDAQTARGQPVSLKSDGQPTPADRQAELVAATGGPAPVGRLMIVAPERPAVETRDDDVADVGPDPSDALNAAQATGAKAKANPARGASDVDTSAPTPPAMR